MSAQRYTNRLALDRMRLELCPECGGTAEQHSSRPEFWLPRARDCSLLPRGVAERIEQYVADGGTVTAATTPTPDRSSPDASR